MAQYSASDLVALAVSGDRDAFAEIYQLHASRVMRHIVYLTSDYHLADELTNETFLKAWKVIDRYEDRGLPIENWLLKIGHNLATRHLKKRRITRDIETVTIEAEDDTSPERRAELASDAQTLREAILQLPEMSRQVIVWRFLEGMSYEECERMLGKSNGAIRVCQFRALKQLRQILEEMEAPAAEQSRQHLPRKAMVAGQAG
jgi:RNA polymerase sigma-70 factor (ECF subfamily)